MFVGSIVETKTYSEFNFSGFLRFTWRIKGWNGTITYQKVKTVKAEGCNLDTRRGLESAERHPLCAYLSNDKQWMCSKIKVHFTTIYVYSTRRR
jgi:hypothetical protein